MGLSAEYGGGQVKYLAAFTARKLGAIGLHGTHRFNHTFECDSADKDFIRSRAWDLAPVSWWDEYEHFALMSVTEVK